MRPTDRLLGTNRPVLHSILQHHYEMKQIFTHPLVSAFHGQQEWSWQDGRKLRQTIKNTSHIWNSKQDISKFYNPSENLAIHKLIVLPKVRAIFRQYISKNTKVLALKFINLVTQLVTYMTWKVYLRKDRHHMAQHLTATHAKVTELSRKKKDLATNCTSTMSFPPLNLYMWNVLSVMWPYVSIKHALQIIPQICDHKTSSRATSVHKADTWNQNECNRKQIFIKF